MTSTITDITSSEKFDKPENVDEPQVDGSNLVIQKVQGVDDQQKEENPLLGSRNGSISEDCADEELLKFGSTSNPSISSMHQHKNQQDDYDLEGSKELNLSSTSLIGGRNASNILSVVSLGDLNQATQEEQITRKIPIPANGAEMLSTSAPSSHHYVVPTTAQQPQQRRYPVGLIRNNQLQKSTMTVNDGDDALVKNAQTEVIHPADEDSAIKEAEKLKLLQKDMKASSEKERNEFNPAPSLENRSKLEHEKSFEGKKSLVQETEDKKIKNNIRSGRGTGASKPGAFAVAPKENSSASQKDGLSKQEVSLRDEKEKKKDFLPPGNNDKANLHDKYEANQKDLKKYDRGKASTNPGAVFVPHVVEEVRPTSETPEDEKVPQVQSDGRLEVTPEDTSVEAALPSNVGVGHDEDEDEALAAAIAASNDEAAAIAQEELEEQERIRERERREAGKREFSNQHNQAALRTHANPGVVIAPSDPFANALRQSSQNTICVNVNTTNQLQQELESSVDNGNVPDIKIDEESDSQKDSKPIESNGHQLGTSNTTQETENLGALPSPATVVPFSQEEHYDPETPIIDAHVERAPEADIEEGMPLKEKLRQERHEKRKHFMEKFIKFKTPNNFDGEDGSGSPSSKDEPGVTKVKSIEFFRGACICHQRVCVVLSVLALIVIVGVAIAVPLSNTPPGNDPARLNSISNIVSSSNVSLESDLNTAGSAQSKSLEWLAWYDPLQVSTTNVEHILRRYVLVVFYFSLGGGDSWENEFYFLGDDNECRWHDEWDQEDNMFHGVTCNDQDDVIFLDFYKNNLKGTIPWKELSSLSKLERLHLNNNEIVGSISGEALQSLQQLERLKLALNTLTGSFPNEIGGLSSLQILDLRGTKQLVGTLPPSIASLTNLTVLSVADNQLTGTVPTTYSNLTSLEQFWIYSNQITGNVDFLCDTIQGGGSNIAADCQFNEVICTCNCTCFSR